MNVAKSFEKSNNPIIDYCAKITVKQDPIEKELTKATLALGREAIMMGAPEVLQFGKNFIRLIGAKRCLDVGTFTGASALAWALALPDDGEVATFDVDHGALDKVGRPLIKQRPNLEKKITFHLGPALDKLDDLIAKGETGKWDFAFIDADKANYSNYYERCVTLLRSGGVIFIDNALWSGRVAGQPENFTEDTKTIDAVNKKIAADDRVDNCLLNLGDGTHVVFKK